MHRGSNSQPDDLGRPDTIVARFLERASTDPVRVAYLLYPMGALQALTRLTWGDWIAEARSASGALLSLHASPGDRVAIFADSRALWPIACMGVMMCGAVPVAIHPQCKSEELVAQLTDCGANVVIVDTIARFKLLRAVQSSLSKHITVICDDLEPLRTSVAEGVYEFESWCKAGAKALDEYEPMRAQLTGRIAAVHPTHSALITYAFSGKTATVLTHENLLASTVLLVSTFSLTFADRVTSYAPLNEPFEIQLAIFGAICAGYTTALLEHSSDAFTAARQFESTVFSGASRAFVKLRETFEVARGSGSYLRDAACEMLGRHCRLAVLYGDVLPEQLHRDLRSGGVALATVYGTAEQICICVNGPQKFDDESIGVPFAGVEIRIGAHNELLVKRSALSVPVSPGDRHAQEEHASWLHTGDRVQHSAANSFRVIGHTRDLLRFDGGRTIAPQPMEAALSALPLVAYAVCDADGVDSVVAVLSLKQKAVEAWAILQGIAMPWEALVALPVLYEELARGVAQVNAQFAFTERIAAFAPTDLEFTVQTGELDNAGDIVRPVVASRFRHVFAELHKHQQF